MIPCSRFTRFRFGTGSISYQTSFVVIAILTFISSTASAPQTDSPIHYFTWSGFPVLSFREADNFVTESPTQYSPKLFHFPVPFTFNGKPALVVHMNKPTGSKTRFTNTSDVTSPATSYTPVPANTSALPTSILSPSLTNEGSTSASNFGFMPLYPSAERPNTYKSSATQTRISPGGALKLHKTFVGNGRPHSFFVIKAPGRRINEFSRKSQRRRNKPRPNVRRSL